MKNKSGNKRGLHGKQGRKKKEDPRNININIRLNESEKLCYDYICKRLGLSQADTLVFLSNLYNEV